MSKAKAITLVLPYSKPAQIERALIAYGQVQEVHNRLRLLFQAAQGACLLSLQVQYGFTPGGDRKSAAPIKTADCGFDSWAAFVKARFGFSDDKALRRINQWKAAALLIEKLPAADQHRIAGFLLKPMAPLTAADVKALEKVTHKIALLQDELDEVNETKFLKAPHGSRLTGRKKETEPVAGERTEPTPELLIKDEVLAPLDRILEHWHSPLKIGEKSKAPLWQHMEKWQLREVIRKVQQMVEPAQEALKK